MAGRTVAVGLTPGQIVEAALALMDEHGQEWLTMRRLAEHLGVSAPTLYWHVKNREELMDLAIDAALDGGEFTTSDDPDWRVRVSEFMHGLRDRLTAHPWVTELTRNRYTHSVHQLTVHAVDVAASIGLPATETADRARLMIWQVNGFTTMENNIRAGTAYHQPVGRGSTFQVTSPVAPDEREATDYDAELATLDIDALFDLTVQLFIAGIESVAGDRRSTSRSRRR